MNTIALPLLAMQNITRDTTDENEPLAQYLVINVTLI